MSSGSVNGAANEEADKLTPKRFFLEEEAVNGKVGESLLADMVRGGLFSEKPSMPPPEVFKWYVMFVVFEFVKYEHAWLFIDHSEECEAVFGQYAQELEALLGLMASQKMLGLQANVQNVLKTRSLYLPAGYKPPF